MLGGALPLSSVSICVVSRWLEDEHVCGACRFSDLNLPPKNWTFPCTVATLGEIKVWPLAHNMCEVLSSWACRRHVLRLSVTLMDILCSWSCESSGSFRRSSASLFLKAVPCS